MSRRPAWPFGELAPLRYGAIIADPPWAYELWSEKGQGKSAQSHYECMALDEMKKLPVSHLAQRDCLMGMWATAPMIRQALELLDAWGFRYLTLGTWAKQSPTGRKLAFGTGYILRNASEVYLLGAVGEPRIKSKSVRNLILAPTRGHSRKPDQFYADIENLVDGPYLELFGRQRWPGWDSWGNQLDRFQAEATA